MDDVGARAAGGAARTVDECLELFDAHVVQVRRVVQIHPVVLVFCHISLLEIQLSPSQPVYIRWLLNEPILALVFLWI